MLPIVPPIMLPMTVFAKDLPIVDHFTGYKLISVKAEAGHSVPTSLRFRFKNREIQGGNQNIDFLPFSDVGASQ